MCEKNLKLYIEKLRSPSCRPDQEMYDDNFEQVTARRPWLAKQPADHEVAEREERPLSIQVRLLIESESAGVFNEEIGYETVIGLVRHLDDAASNKGLFGHLARHASWEVRCSVAGMDNIDEATVELLCQDPCIEVRRALSDHALFREWASTAILHKLAAADIECARNIAYNLRDFTRADVNLLAGELSRHTDPDIRRVLASTYATPKKILRQLLWDGDPGVRASARSTLRA